MPLRRRIPRYRKKQAIRRRKGVMMKKGGKKFKYGGIKYYKETAKPIAINMPAAVGGVPATLAQKLYANFSEISNDVPDGATVGTRDSFTSLYSRYAIVGVRFKFIPAATQSNQGFNPADRVSYAISRDPNGIVNDEMDVVRQNDSKFTNTTKGFSIYVKNPEPILYQTAGLSNVPATTGVPPVQTNQVAASISQRKWNWLPTRLGLDRQVHPDHVGADMFIQSLNANGPAYQAYTMFKTIYFAFKEQD